MLAPHSPRAAPRPHSPLAAPPKTQPHTPSEQRPLTTLHPHGTAPLTPRQPLPQPAAQPFIGEPRTWLLHPPRGNPRPNISDSDSHDHRSRKNHKRKILREI